MKSSEIKPENIKENRKGDSWTLDPFWSIQEVADINADQGNQQAKSQRILKTSILCAVLVHSHASVKIHRAKMYLPRVIKNTDRDILPLSERCVALLYTKFCTVPETISSPTTLPFAGGTHQAVAGTRWPVRGPQAPPARGSPSPSFPGTAPASLSCASPHLT